MRRLTAISLFSGAGGFDLGAQQAGLRVIWANDIDPAAATAYRELLPRVRLIAGDVRGVQEFPRADVLIGCYPCTGFSVGARRRWHKRRARDLKANRNNYLYREFLRALRQVQPKYFFVENVRGLIAADDGWFLERQIEGFKRHGYHVKSQVLDAKNYGVSQSRRRLFIVGVRREKGAFDYEFPAPTHGPRAASPMATLRDVIGGLDRWPTREYYDYPFHGHYLTRQRKRGWTEQSFTIVADMRHVPLHPMGQPMRYIGVDSWELRGWANRRLSWRECALIQGLEPDAIEPVRSLGARDGHMDLALKYRVAGNAVPPALSRALVEPVVQFEAGNAQGRTSGQS